MHMVASAGVRTTVAPCPSEGTVWVTEYDGACACDVEYERCMVRGRVMVRSDGEMKLELRRVKLFRERVSVSCEVVSLRSLSCF